MKKIVNRIGRVSSVALSIALALPAAAQTANADAPPSDPNDIVVTAQKRAQNLQDVSGSIAAVSGKDIAETGTNSFADYVNTVPSLSVAAAGPGLSTLALRGITTGGVRNDEPQNKETVGVYIDETPISVNGFNPDLGLYDMERIEVLRGPQGTLYGSGSMGGTIRIITKKPVLDRVEGSYEGTLSGTDHGSANYDVRGMLNLPIVTDKVAVRAIAYHNYTSGYIDNPLTGQKNINDAETTGARVELGAAVTDNVKVNLTYMYHDLKTGGRPDQTSPYQRTTRAFDGLTDRIHIANGTIDFDMGPATLTSSTSYLNKLSTNRNTLEFLLSSVLGFNSTAPLVDTTKVEDFSQEIRLASNGSHRFNYVVGAFFQHRVRDYTQNGYVPGFDNFVGIASTDLGTPRSDQVFYGTQDIRQTQIALFGEVSYKIVPKVTATVGGRYFHYKEKYQTYSSGLLNGGVSSGAGDFSEGGFTPKFDLTYKSSDNHLFYALASKGFRLGGVNTTVPADLCRADLRALGRTNAAGSFGSDSVWNFEAGTKNQFMDRRLTINASGYYIRWQDMQTTLTLPSCSFSFRTNAGKARSLGVEVESRFAATDSLNLYGTFGFTDSRLTEDVLFTTWKDGDTVPAVPRFQVSAGARQGFRLFDMDDSYLRLDYSYISQEKTNIDSNLPQNRYFGDYSLVNAQIGTRIPGSQVEFLIFARNLLNSRGRVAAFAASLQAPERYIMVQPRTIGVTVQGRF